MTNLGSMIGALSFTMTDLGKVCVYYIWQIWEVITWYTLLLWQIWEVE